MGLAPVSTVAHLVGSWMLVSVTYDYDKYRDAYVYQAAEWEIDLADPP